MATLSKYQGGATVKGGFYWNTAEWEIVTVEGRRGTLADGPGYEYMRIPTLAFIPLSLVFGALYVVFLPFIGFAMLVSMGGRKGGRGLLVVARSILQKLAALTAPEA
jgi:hypothetical protein